MRYPLDGAKLKVVWAQKQLESLNDEIAGYLSTDPYEFPAELDGNKLIARPAVIKPGCEPPQELSCTLSSCVGALRSALDYITWEIATKHSSPPPIVGTDKGIFFPLLDSPQAEGANGFAKMVTKWAFPAAAARLIESVQPYHAGYEILGTLSALINQDKHCLPLLTIATADTASINITIKGKPLDECEIHVPGSCAIVSGFGTLGMNVRRLTEDEFLAGAPARLAALKAAAPVAAEQQTGRVKVDGQVAVFVSLDDIRMPREPVERTLDQIVKCVADIVPRFETFF